MTQKKRIGLALAGGGPAGAIYEIGAVRALEEAIEGLSFNDFDVYVGISAGAFISANLVNNVSTATMCRAVVSTDPDEHPFAPETFLTPALNELWRSTSNFPRTVLGALRYLVGGDEDKTLLKSVTRLSRSLPVALFDNQPIRRYLEKVYSREGRTNDFRELDRTLYVVATDLDSGEAVVFGRDRKEIPISQAVQASSALPGLYPPVLIDGRYYVDGVLLKTLHASTILETGLDLAICINPIVPVDTRTAVELGYMRRGRLIDRGMPGVLSQTFRTMIHSRMNAGFANYAERYETDIMLVEPSKEDYRMFFTNIFSFASRKRIAEHAYHSTLVHLSENRDEYAATLAKHGLRLRTELLDRADEQDLWLSVKLPEDKLRKIYPARRRRHPVSNELGDALARVEALVARKKHREEQQESRTA